MSEVNEESRHAVADERKATGQRRYREVMMSDAPPPLSPYLDKGVVDSVFGELWDRAGLSRRERRFITLACVGGAAVEEPINQHVFAALASGDVTREEFQEFVLHLRTTRAGRGRRRSSLRTTRRSNGSTHPEPAPAPVSPPAPWVEQRP